MQRFWKTSLTGAIVAMVLTMTQASAQETPYALVIIKATVIEQGKGMIPVSLPVNFTELARILKVKDDVSPDNIVAAIEGKDGRLTSALSQFDPAKDFNPHTNAAGTLSLMLPAGVEHHVRLYFTKTAPELPSPLSVGALNVRKTGSRITISNDYYTVTHDPGKLAGLPSRIEFRASGKVFNTYVLNDRVHDPQLGSFHLRNDTEPKIELVASGPVRAMVRIHARYMQPNGRRPDSQPEATYKFSYYAGSPVVHVTAAIRQQREFNWRELHFIEINFPDESFTSWAIGDPMREGKFQANKRSERSSNWGALIEDNSVLGFLGGAIIYDGRGEYGTYLHGPWVSWSTKERNFTGALWIGTTQEGAKAVQRASERIHAVAEAYVTVPALLKLMEQLRDEISKLPPSPRRGRFTWSFARIEKIIHSQSGLLQANSLASRLHDVLQQGKDASDVVPWFAPRERGLRFVDNGQIGIGFDIQNEGISLVSFFDLQAERELLSGEPNPFWSIEARGSKGEEFTLVSSAGWHTVKSAFQGRKKNEPLTIEISWNDPIDKRLSGLTAHSQIKLDGPQSLWRLEIENESKIISLWHVRFPQVWAGRIGNSAEDDYLVVPKGAGTLHKAPLLKSANFTGSYPTGWCTMQFMAHYDSNCGLYIAVHDPLASTKELKVEQQRQTAGSESALVFSYNWPAEDMGVPGNGFRMPGPAVLATFKGDWFDAAQIYKNWVKAEAPWWPERGKPGRSDTPQWMQDIAVWALGGGPPESCVEAVIAFARYMGVPTAFHWYNWHEIPFDNNYPHYFPTKKRVADGVRKLQAAGVRVMPYINGRLWDTDLEDFQNSAIKYATKNEKGEPYIEVYGSGEKLAPMCPTTKLWRETVQGIVLRLMSKEVGVDGVYIDQVAAAGPRLCFDKTHGHPLGGGHWWTVDGYWPMIKELQKRMGNNKFITTECNAEPYVNLFDGYLTWHWQHQGQIPLFSAVYAGKIQLFGRAYRGGPTRELALRMKAGQSLVFGEQIGWIDPNVIKDKVGGPFIRRMARLRYALRNYFTNGEMARPPRLEGEIPKVTADWQWSGKWLVTTDALLSGAWRTQDGRLALIFVNVTDKELSAELVFNGENYGFKRGQKLKVTPRTENGTSKPRVEDSSFRRMIKLAKYQAVALEIE